MQLERARLREALPAPTAGERLLSGMNPPVDAKAARVLETLPTAIARERLLSAVDPQVGFKAAGV